MNDTDSPEKSRRRVEEELPPETFSVMRQHGTERAGTSPLNKEHRPGMYACAACGQPLFESSTKFDSGTGWPSFSPLPKAVGTPPTAASAWRASKCTARAAGDTWARVPGRSESDRRALLHERRGAVRTKCCNGRDNPAAAAKCATSLTVLRAGPGRAGNAKLVRRTRWNRPTGCR